ncbi:hypothetical protein HPB48_021355 [Haemaphysalis longicornis]|uniref:Uncharacterized protein n=1 Tax=Haemaphysalis longicornis TaxID=44386 RepID=A0A9J6H1C8_HAELO|nr:hypothetical protein HPB48_021355 [Haemaphysalis longicornis]
MKTTRAGSNVTGAIMAASHHVIPQMHRTRRPPITEAHTPLRNQATRQRRNNQNRPIQRPRFPRLPKDDIKVVIRPRDGLNVARISEATLRDSILRAAGLEQELASTDIFRANQTQNIVVISTAFLERAVRYTGIEQIKIGVTTYATRA